MHTHTLTALLAFTLTANHGGVSLAFRLGQTPLTVRPRSRFARTKRLTAILVRAAQMHGPLVIRYTPSLTATFRVSFSKGERQVTQPVLHVMDQALVKRVTLKFRPPEWRAKVAPLPRSEQPSTRRTDTDTAWCARNGVLIREVWKNHQHLQVPDLTSLARHLWRTGHQHSNDSVLCENLRLILDDRFHPLWTHMVHAQLADQASRGTRKTPPLAGLLSPPEGQHPFPQRVRDCLYLAVKMAALHARQERTATEGLEKRGLVENNDTIGITDFLNPDVVYVQGNGSTDLGAEHALTTLANLSRTARDASRTRADMVIQGAEINRHQDASLIPDDLAVLLPALRGPDGTLEEVDPTSVPQLSLLLSQLKQDESHLSDRLEDALERVNEIADPFVEYGTPGLPAFIERRHTPESAKPFVAPPVTNFVFAHGKALKDFPETDRDRIWQRMLVVAERALRLAQPTVLLASTTPGFGLACLKVASDLNLPVFAMHHQADLITPADATMIVDVLAAQAKLLGRRTIREAHQGAFLTWASSHTTHIVALDEPGTRSRTWHDQPPLSDALLCAMLEADTRVPVTNHWRTVPAS